MSRVFGREVMVLGLVESTPFQVARVRLIQEDDRWTLSGVPVLRPEGMMFVPYYTCPFDVDPDSVSLLLRVHYDRSQSRKSVSLLLGGKICDDGSIVVLGNLASVIEGFCDPTTTVTIRVLSVGPYEEDLTVL